MVSGMIAQDEQSEAPAGMSAIIVKDVPLCRPSDSRGGDPGEPPGTILWTRTS